VIICVFFKERNGNTRHVVAGNSSDNPQNCVICSVRIQCAVVSYIIRIYWLLYQWQCNV
jgi:hypothetical protein